MHNLSDAREIPDAPGGVIGPVGGLLEDNPMGDFLHWVNQLLRPQDEPWIDRRDIPDLPLGDTNVLPFPTMPGNQLPDLGDVQKEPQVSNPVDEIISVWNESNYMTSVFWQPGVTLAGVQYMERNANPVQVDVPPPISLGDWKYPEVDPNYVSIYPDDWNDWPAPTTFPGENDMSFWDDLGDIGIEWINTQINPGFVNPGQFPIPTTPPPSLPVPQNGGGLVPPGGPPGVTCNTSCGPYPVMKMVCGQYKWVMPKRKRRRALLTESDYNALLRVQNLKVNQNMTVAIAKALTR